MINESIIDAMVRTAKDAMSHAHSPYSGRAVGACILASDGTLYGGCSVENASYGLCRALGQALSRFSSSRRGCCSAPCRSTSAPGCSNGWG